MPKTKRQRRTGGPGASAARQRTQRAIGAPDHERPRDLPDWRWRSFPVLCAFVSGMLLAFLSHGATSNPVAFVLLIAALLGCGYCLAHLVVTNVIVAGRVHRRRASIARGEEQPGEYEDELVYRDGPGIGG